MNYAANKSPELSLKDVSIHLLSLFAQKLSRKDYLDSVVNEIAGWTDCRCIGIRILNADGYIPYESCRGFSPQFLERENRLSIKDDVCACIRVIRSEFELADQSARTPYGSFHCEDSTRFLAGLTEDQKRLYRGVCVEAGFKTICVIPIRHRNEISGAIHLADQREAVVTRKVVEAIESVALLIGEAVFRYGLEKALADSEVRYRTLIENSPCGIYLVQDGKIVFANEAFAGNHGYIIDDMIGIDSLETIHPADRHLVEDIRQRRLKGEDSPTEYEVRGIRKNGETIWIQRRNVRIDYNGKPAILGYALDVSERKKHESALNESHELLESIFSNIHFLVAYMDKDFNFIRANRAYAEADGRSPEFFIGKNHFDLYPHEENEHIFRKVVETGQPFFVYGKPFEYASNPERGLTYWDWSLQPVKDTVGRINGLVLSLVNITDRKRAEEALHQANADLERRTEEISQRAAQLSRLTSELTLSEQRERRRIAEILHDNLQQLLVGAKIGQETLIHGIDDARKPGAEHILKLITQSIDTARYLSAELSPPVLRSGDLSASLEWLARRMRENQGFEVHLHIEPGIVLDRKDLTVLLFQSVRELLLNVIKHAGVNSADLRMEQENGELRIVVRDTGRGFDPETVWYSGSHDRFGLITIRERLLHLGGRFEVESAVDAGSAISLVVLLEEEKASEKELPEMGRAIEERPYPAPADTGGMTGKIRVMLVDDHPVVRQGMSTMLGLQPDIEVVCEASDGEKAVQLACEIVPDVILMDINMPKMNGLEATRIIHSEFPHIRIIALSMHDADDQAAAMINAGASAYRCKSENTALLLATIRGEGQ